MTHQAMKTTVRPPLRNRLLLPLPILALPLIGIAWYVRTAPARAERALEKATYSQLVEAVKNDPGNPRALYYFGLRNRDLGRIGPARAALAHAAELDPDSEDIALAWANVEGEAGNDQKTFEILTALLKRHPKSAEAHWALALFYVTHSDPGRAYQEAITVTALHPQDVRAWRLAGVQALSMRQASMGEAALRRAVALDPKDWRSQFGLGEALTSQARDREALTAYQAAATLAPEEPMILARLGRAQLTTATMPQDLQNAVVTLTRAVQIDPDNALAQLSLGQAHLRQGDYAGAKTALLQAERLAASLANFRSPLHTALLQVCMRLNDPAGAQREKRLLQESNRYNQQMDWLRTHLITGQLDDKTCLKFARLCEENGDSAEAIYLYRRLLGDPAYSAQARQSLARLAQTAPRAGPSLDALAPTATEDVSVLLHDADSLLQQKQVAQAVDAYQAILRKDPNSAPAWQGLGAAYKQTGQNEAAFHALNRALQLQPNLPQAQLMLADLYYDMGLQDEATRRIQRLIQQAPPKAEYFDALGDCLRDDPLTYARAEDNYRRAVQMDPHQSDYLVNLEDMETLTNKLPDAETHYRQALQMAPNSAHAQLALGQFLLRQQGTPERQAEAERLLRSALAQVPNSIKALLSLGQLLTQRGDAKDAVPLLEHAVLLAPNQPSAWYNLARAYEMLHNKERSQYCYAAFRRLSHLSDALDSAVDETRNHPKSGPSHLKLARLYAQKGAYAKAINQYEVYLALDPSDTSVHKELQRLIDQLRASGHMPNIGFFNEMVAASVKFH